MPRQARVRDNYGTYHIYQRSQDDRELFRSEADRAVFWQVLTEASERFPVRLLGYCLLDSSSYHLLMKFDGCDISQLMKSINISYVRGINAAAGLFRDRFQSDLFRATEDIEALRESLRQRAEGQVKWNSFCHFDQQALTEAGLRLTKAAEVFEDEASGSACSGDSCLDNPDDVREFLDAELDCINIDFEAMLLNLDLRNDLICACRLRSTLSLKQIGELFGGLSESSISKIIKQHKRSPLQLA